MKNHSDIARISMFIFTVFFLTSIKVECQNVAWTDSTYSFRGKIGKDSISIFLCRARFDKTKHVLSSTGDIVVNNATGEHPVIDKIDGHDVWGSESGHPKYELSQFEVSLNGQPVKIPKNLYNDCYNPHTNIDGIRVVMADDKKSVLVEMNSGDASNAYFVWWTIDLTGKITRYISWGE